MNILMIGNCQAESLAALFMAMLDNAQVPYVRLLPADILRLRQGGFDLSRLKGGDSDLGTLVRKSELILIQNGFEITKQFEAAFPSMVLKVRMFPRLSFIGFHPDMLSLRKPPPCPTGFYHSSLACYGWVNGLCIDDTINLFKEDVFAELGFFDYYQSAVNFLLTEAEKTGLSLDGCIERWTENGVWMHTIDHPNLPVLADLARAILMREGIPFRPDVEHYMADSLARRSTWSVYPEIADRLGIRGGYVFKGGGGLISDIPPPPLYDLEGFVRASFKCYAGHDKNLFVCDRLSSPRYQRLGQFLKRRDCCPTVQELDKDRVRMEVERNPYVSLPDYQFWRRAIERMPMHEVDPVVRPRFTLKRDDKVATAGSCFAQHISRTLVKNGFNYFISEHGDGLPAGEAQQRNYGVFSARFGNLYTTRQLLQLFDRAYGLFVPVDNSWVRGDGRLIDPFRPQVEPEGFATVEQLEGSRAEHFAAVREMFEKLDVFVFTLGLTEAWRSRIDGAVYPLAPGVVGGEPDAGKHEFVNFSAAEVTADMQAFVDRLLRVNPQARIILTVSPVPLIATYEDRHVLVSTTYSKSVLRVAAEEVCQRNTMCAYFPSYEIITGNYTRSEYFESDLRQVKPQGVDHVMRLFLAHYSAEKVSSQIEEELMRENAAVAEVVCDEEAIDE